MIQKDKRASRRFQAKPGSYIIYVEGVGAIRDVSMGGVFVLDSAPLPVGATLKFSLRFGTQDVALQGIVRRSVAQEGIGIQFSEMPSEAKRLLRSYIASLG